MKIQCCHVQNKVPFIWKGTEAEQRNICSNSRGSKENCWQSKQLSEMFSSFLSTHLLAFKPDQCVTSLLRTKENERISSWDLLPCLKPGFIVSSSPYHRLLERYLKSCSICSLFLAVVADSSENCQPPTATEECSSTRALMLIAKDKKPLKIEVPMHFQFWTQKSES